MATKNFDTRTFVLIILFVAIIDLGICSNSLISRTNFQVPNIFGQDLTAEIDQVLKENNLTYRPIIKEALRWSRVVYYESDILLTEIEDIIQVIDLLSLLAPEEALPVKITLSLPYINKTNGQFLLHRLGDIYYSLEANITAEQKSKVLKSLTSITLNFLLPEYHERSAFKYGNEWRDFLFVNYVKSFVSFYFGSHAIPVGLMWNKNMHSTNLVKKQIPEADFLVFYTEYGIYNRFPVSMEKFDAYMETCLRDAPKNSTVFMKTKGKVTQDFKTLWKYDGLPDLYTLMGYKSSPFQNLSEIFINKLLKKSGKFFDYVKLSWANMKNRDVITGTALQNLSTEIFSKPEGRSKLILPLIKMEEVTSNGCALKAQFKKWGNNYEVIIMDELSWRTLARFQDDLTDGPLNCNEMADNKTTTQSGTLKVVLEFTNGIANQWTSLDLYMINMIRFYPKISEMVLDTIIFHDEDIKNSLKIQEFIFTIQKNPKIGCSVQYSSILAAIQSFTRYRNELPEDTFEKALEGTLCTPIFKLLNVMVWYAPENEGYNEGSYYSRDQIFSANSNIFLTREIFQNVFPNITVYIKLSSDFDKQILANIFDAQIIVPSNQILY